ncbi:hypothetical protein KP509_14G001800 [Ceratopteris richardii]|uniref:Hexosyltransferase n=1 Tax=Ceratopteris richardii TaxID=49495 RepID=A0A8T2T8Z4_CERRI|nr:hypothetical protein KP509_14G001800 [Ceratopteris richardii]
MVRLLPRHRSTKAMKVMQLLLTLHFFLLLRNHNTAHSARHKSTATDFRLPSGSHELDSTRPRPQPPVRQEEHPPLTRWPTTSLTDAALPQPQIIAELPRFREAASFRNGEECAPIHQQKSGGSEQQQQLCDAASVHIAMTLDAAYIRGSIAAVLSIVQHTACPENLAFHFIASRMEEKLSVLLSSTFPYLRFKLYKFDEGILQGKISPSVRNSLEQPLNYARTYIADILPSCIKRVIYLDSDLIVVDDVAKLWRTDLNGHALAAPQYCHVDFSHYFNSVFWENAQLSAVFRGRKLCYFNTGVMVMDLEKWRRSYYVQAIECWMEVALARSRTAGTSTASAAITYRENAEVSIQALSAFCTGAGRVSRG